MGARLTRAVSSVLIVASFALFLPPQTSAVGKSEVSPGSPQPEQVAEVSSFELFWPLVAGKTRGDTFYSFKLLKERLRGMLIFGDAEKANYSVFLATKRSLEAEKLFKNDKAALAEETLNDTLKELDQANRSIQLTKEKKQSFAKNGQMMLERLTNIRKLALYLHSKYPSEKLQQVGDRAEALAMSLK